MKATKTFIEDAVKGRWKYKGWDGLKFAGRDIMLDCIFTDPLAWQAVGKTRGWVVGHFDGKPTWLFNQHIFIDHLADGDSLEEALEKITN